MSDGKMKNLCRIVPVGDCAVSVEFENEISAVCNAKVAMLTKTLKAEEIRGVIEMNPTYRALLINYDPERISYKRLEKTIQKSLVNVSSHEERYSRVFLIPVCYGGKYGEDLEDVAAHNGLSPEEVIARHSGNDYLIYMLGFLPGFSYLGGMDPSLNTPRLKQPRQLIPAGSVGIGGSQTGIYPLDSPGGWRLIGRTPVRPYDKEKEKILYAVGDYIRFCPIDEAEYKRIAAKIEAGTYQVPIERKAVES